MDGFCITICKIPPLHDSPRPLLSYGLTVHNTVLNTDYPLLHDFRIISSHYHYFLRVLVTASTHLYVPMTQ
jgi:hypothetical protein